MQERGRQTRRQLITEMRRAIHQKGVTRTSIGDILKATGAKKGSLYFHFQDKDDLALTALDDAGKYFQTFVANALSHGETPEEQLAGFFQAALDLHRRKGFVGGCVFGNTALEMADTDERYVRLMQDVFEAWGDQLAAVIERAQEAGRLNADAPAQSLARQILASVEGGIMQARLAKSEEPLREVLDTTWRLIGGDPALSPGLAEEASHD
ncbi:TetR family transcriptional regulator C-terminal domain-containing protein [Thiohalorhabdus sp.]|uniref:TetR family transcriptional regulator C-terminal domain-containing protein n=1 Tax=Thiohalorhabdus sp. TaxID=3094134 RepID=UPI002FC2FE24